MKCILWGFWFFFYTIKNIFFSWNWSFIFVLKHWYVFSSAEISSLRSRYFDVEEADWRVLLGPPPVEEKICQREKLSCDTVLTLASGDPTDPTECGTLTLRWNFRVVCSWGEWARSLLHWHWLVFGDAPPKEVNLVGVRLSSTEWGLTVRNSLMSAFPAEVLNPLFLNGNLGSTSRITEIKWFFKEINFTGNKSSMYVHCSEEK